MPAIRTPLPVRQHEDQPRPSRARNAIVIPPLRSLTHSSRVVDRNLPESTAPGTAATSSSGEAGHHLLASQVKAPHSELVPPTIGTDGTVEDQAGEKTAGSAAKISKKKKKSSKSKSTKRQRKAPAAPVADAMPAPPVPSTSTAAASAAHPPPAPIVDHASWPWPNAPPLDPIDGAVGRQLYGAASLFPIRECTEEIYEPDMQDMQNYLPLPDDELWDEFVMHERGTWIEHD